jgi:chromate reductase
MQILGISGSLRKASLNTVALRACNELLPQGMSLRITSIADLPLFNQDVFDAGIPEPAKRLRAEIAQADGVLIASPEYNFSVSAALKNAIDWASRPWGQNSFHHIPAGVIGASIGAIGTAVGQQSLRAVLSFCNARQMTSPEAYITYSAERFREDGEVIDESTANFLKDYMAEFRDHVVRVLTVLPRP